MWDRSPDQDENSRGIADNSNMDLHEAAQDRFGKSRADELRSEIEVLAEDIRKIRSVPLEEDDEP